ncbi:hypothetical protein OEZ85_005238 [Tetradesmus obliquus]|uniref:Uncharacterized protein n=1 Tax=Tetradesmus obliquus TaxID=3088 RepID=A0ABY8UI17_TETOB|nr:hypothetical protein OEZ85_005238 [Tetradesmus obliquus]
MARKYLMLLAVVALLATSAVVRCQDDEEPTVMHFSSEPEAAAEAAEAAAEPIPAATPTPAAATPTPAAAAGSMDAYKELATEYLNKATETATVYVAQAQELATEYLGQAQELLASTLDKLGVKKPAGKTEL